MTGAGSFDGDAFAELQSRLAPIWPEITLRRRPGQRTLVVVSSLSLDLPASYQPLIAAYEERYLIYVLALATAPGTHVIYVTSQPILPRMVDYYLDLIPTADHDDTRRRLTTLSMGDATLQPLTRKILDRPRTVARIRSLVPDGSPAILIPFVTSDLEVQLGLELGLPIYGTDPRLAHLGTKTGSREVFAAAGVPHPRGTEGVHTVADLVDALFELTRDRPSAAAIVKLDEGVSGTGNAVVDLEDLGVDADRDGLRERILALTPEDPDLDAEGFLALLEARGGIVEERISGDDFCSPSVQLLVSPEGQVEVLTTHDQVLGGPTGQTYYGCRFPAAPDYAALISRHASAIGDTMRDHGVVGRFGVDFVVTRAADGWHAHAIEINLRSGGTTHPFLALMALTEGTYDVDRAEFTAHGTPKHYVASDHLEVPRLDTLTPDDVLDVVAEAGLDWDHVTRTGVVLHMVSGVGVAGRVGLTAIGDTPADAQDRFDRVEEALRDAAAPP